MSINPEGPGITSGAAGALSTLTVSGASTLTGAVAAGAALTVATTVQLGGAAVTASAGLNLKSGTTANEGIAFGTDVVLYRAGAGLLATDGQFYSRVGAATQVNVGSIGGAAGFQLGSAGDTNLYRSGTNNLQTDDALDVALDFQARFGGASAVALGARGPGGESGVLFGSAGDTNLYRSAADTLKTDDDFRAVGEIIGRLGVASQVRVGDEGPAGQAGLRFGSADDTNLYRSAADTLKTDDRWVPGAGQVWKRTATAVSYVVLSTDFIVAVTDTSAARAITVPSAVTAGAGATFVIKDESGVCATNNITLTATAGNIDGAGTLVMATNYQSVTLYSNGTNWFVI